MASSLPLPSRRSSWSTSRLTSGRPCSTGPPTSCGRTFVPSCCAPVPFAARLNVCASSDSSAINVPLADSASIGLTGFEALPGASMGGYALFFAGSGAFSVECFSPRTLGDSSQSAELTMSVWASKAIIAFRIALRELKLGPDGPTELQLDAKAVLDGAGMGKMARRQRYQAVRLAMLRQWIADGVLGLKKLTRLTCLPTSSPSLWRPSGSSFALPESSSRARRRLRPSPLCDVDQEYIGNLLHFAHHFNRLFV